MTAEEVLQLNVKLDKALGIMRETQVDVAVTKGTVAVLNEKLDGHIANESQQQEVRAQTCPHSSDINKNAADTDALAGVQRRHHETLYDPECGLEPRVDALENSKLRWYERYRGARWVFVGMVAVGSFVMGRLDLFVGAARTLGFVK